MANKQLKQAKVLRQKCIDRISDLAEFANQAESDVTKHIQFKMHFRQLANIQSEFETHHDVILTHLASQDDADFDAERRVSKEFDFVVLDNWNGGITIAASQKELVALLNVLEQNSAAYGLGINYNKTKIIIVDREHDNHREIKSIGRCEVVQSFVYLGSLIDNSGSCENDIRRRIQQARVAMTKLTKIWRDHNITKATKMLLVQSLVFSIFLYASETWTVKKVDRARIDAFVMWMWRRMLRIPYTAHRTNVSILDELGNPKRLSSIASMRMLTFFGHINRSDNMEKLVVQGHAPSGRCRGRSPTRWVDTTKQLIDISIKSATELTKQTITTWFDDLRNLPMVWIKFQKAFDTTSHELIVPLLESLSVDDQILKSII
ncbi:unnamed protein product [Callosobruchus maculatus]|uniref:Reverse transcriptase domain-containing protein n=1 Tax=Callosobruchus maculatus TaxID=64391 RepID=A0A653DHQ3_CALMS|nr:unnamed protein product [Callosobruchus maculatus]